MSRYKAEWKPYSANKRFWNEVLKGRTIKKLEWNGKNLKAFILDDGQRIFICPGNKPTLAVKD